MRFQALLLPSLFLGVAYCQGVTEVIAPMQHAPPGCQASAPGLYEMSLGGLPGLQKRANDKKFLITLKDGVLTDNLQRTGYIADNYQFQFDGPPQAGAIFTAGFSLCQNGSIAIGNKAVWYRCTSGEFANLYDRWWAEQCEPIGIHLFRFDEPNTETKVATLGPSGQPAVSSSVVKISSTGSLPVFTKGTPSQSPSSVLKLSTTTMPKLSMPSITGSPTASSEAAAGTSSTENAGPTIGAMNQAAFAAAVGGALALL